MSPARGARSAVGRFAGRLLADYGILLALIALCLYFTAVTTTERPAEGAEGGSRAAHAVARWVPPAGRVLILTRPRAEDTAFETRLREELSRRGYRVSGSVRGGPPEMRRALERAASEGSPPAAVVCPAEVAGWPVLRSVRERVPALRGLAVIAPAPVRGSTFLQPENLLNIANQIAVIAIVAVGMTLVILTGGIDLSVGSLLALSAVITTLLIRDRAGAESAGAPAMVLCSAAGIVACGGVGALSGALVTWARLPPFIVTLGTMLVGSGLAFLVAKGQSIYQVPEGFVWLGRGADLGIPNAVLLAALLYLAAHVMLTRTRLGRHIYAVGSSERAARLSGVPADRVLLTVYTLCGLLAGLGGVVMASQLRSGAPTYGQMYELYVIAAVVVGGTSLAGGQGRVLGTLIGALIIAVIQNGMNLTGVESYTQKVVLGLVILGAVLLDVGKRRGSEWLRRRLERPVE